MMRHRATHTVAELEISPQAFDEIAGLLRAADYGHVFLEDGRLLDMTGIGLTRRPETESPGGQGHG